MNKVHKIKWSNAIAAWVVVSEIVSHVGGKTKRSRGRLLRTVLNSTLILSIATVPMSTALAVYKTRTISNIVITEIVASISGLTIQAQTGWDVGAKVNGSYTSFSVNHQIHSYKTSCRDNSLYLWHHANQYSDANSLRVAILAAGNQVPVQAHEITQNDVENGLKISVLPRDNITVMGEVVTADASSDIRAQFQMSAQLKDSLALSSSIADDKDKPSVISLVDNDTNGKLLDVSFDAGGDGQERPLPVTTDKEGVVTATEEDTPYTATADFGVTGSEEVGYSHLPAVLLTLGVRRWRHCIYGDI